MFSILFGCTGKEDENESTKLVKVPSSGAFSKTNEVKTWRYAHELSDTLTVTNDGITNITGINTIALRMETSNGCAVKYYYFENGQCKIHAAKGKLFFMAKKKSDCSNEPLTLFNTPIIIQKLISKYERLMVYLL